MLHAVYILSRENGPVRPEDIASRMDIPELFVRRAVRMLGRTGFLTKDDDHVLHLTDKGLAAAQEIYERRLHMYKKMCEILSIEADL